MKKITKVLTGVFALSALAAGLAGQANAAPVSWGPTAPTSSAPVTSTNGSHHVTVQTTVFTTSVWATINSNVGTYSNLAQLNASDGSAVARLVNGTNLLNGNIVFFTPLFTTVVSGLGTVTSN
jgi:hypothetical protein